MAGGRAGQPALGTTTGGWRVKTVVTTDALMQPIAHFSHCVRAGALVHVGATAGTDAARRLVGATHGIADLAAQLQRMFENIDTALALAGSRHADIVRIKTYVADVRDFDAGAAAVRRWLAEVDACQVVVGSFGFPLPHALVEADVVAFAATDRGATEPVHLVAAPAPPAASAGARLARDAVQQSRLAVEALERALAARGLQRSDLVHLHATLADVRIAGDFEAACKARLGGAPVAATIVAAPVPGDDVLVQLEAVAVRGGGRAVEPRGVPRPSRAFVPAVLAGELLYIGGQIGMRDDASLPDDVRGQTDLAWRHVEAIVAAAGLDGDAVLRTNNVLADWRSYGGFNAGYGEHVRRPYPPRATMHGGLVHPAALMQIEAIAHARGRDAVVVDTVAPADATKAAGR